MTVLAIDTTHAACSVALADNEAVVAQCHEVMPRGHAERLPGMMSEVLNAAGRDWSNVSRLAVTTGPGSFSGVRIGLSAARGLALALDLPVVGISSLEAIAAADPAFETATVLAVFDARRGGYYTQLFDGGRAVSQAALLSLEEVVDLGRGKGPVRVVGSGAAAIVAAEPSFELSPAAPLPDAATISRLAALRTPTTPVEPLYIRRADAKPQTPLLKTAPMAVTLTAVADGDLDDLAAIHKAGFSRPWSRDELARTLNTAGSVGLVALDNDTRAGFIVVRDLDGVWEILTLVVRPDRRRRGIAQALLEGIIAKAKASGAEKVWLDVDAENFAALGLYEKLGFGVDARRARYFGTNDALLMSLHVAG